MKTLLNEPALAAVLAALKRTAPVDTETVPLDQAPGRVLGAAFVCPEDLPAFDRSLMDGYAVQAASILGATCESPVCLKLDDAVPMGGRAGVAVGPGRAAPIATGGALPRGADAVVRIEHTEAPGGGVINVHRSVAAGCHMVKRGEDFQAGGQVIFPGQRLRAQEIGLLAAVGVTAVTVYKRARVGIVSTGDELVPATETPRHGRVRDANAHSLAALVNEAGGVAVSYGIVPDDADALYACCCRALCETDMVLISGGSSVGARDHTAGVMARLPDGCMLAHGLPVRPGKPTLLATAGGKPVWGLPGHALAALVMFTVMVRLFLDRRNGIVLEKARRWPLAARMCRRVPSVRGRIDFVRVRLEQQGENLLAEPVSGASGLINSLVKADGLVVIGTECDAIETGAAVTVVPV